jgi:peptidyl-prolyl cis-trans isomerase A (cyclophilin A)
MRRLESVALRQRNAPPAYLAVLFAALAASACQSQSNAQPGAAPSRSAPAVERGARPTSGEAAPAEYTVSFDTTEGEILVDVHRDWAPRGADRFYELVKSGFFTDVAFFRVIDGFMAQTGIHGDPQTASQWRERRIPDDPAGRQSNTRGMVSFATAGPNTRTTQFFINTVDNRRLDSMGFAPFGRVRDMGPVERLYSGYGEGAPSGRGPDQSRIQREGNAYLRASFPELDYIRSARIVDE